MTEAEAQKAVESGKVEQVPTTPVNTQNPSAATQPPTLDEFIAVLRAMQAVRQHLTSAPDFTPKSFADQIQLLDDGAKQALYAFINGSWAEIGAPKFHIGSFTQANNNNDLVISGVGFTPKLVVLFASFPGDDTGSWSLGFATTTGSGQSVEFRIFNIGTASAVLNYWTDTIRLDTLAAGIISNVKTLGADGFTLDWSGVAGGYTVTGIYLAIG